MNIDVQDIHENLLTHKDKQHDVEEFFHAGVTRETNGKKKKYCTCKLCP